MSAVITVKHSRINLQCFGSNRKEVRLFAVVMVNHQAAFEEHGFIMEKAWKRYVKMQKR